MTYIPSSYGWLVSLNFEAKNAGVAMRNFSPTVPVIDTLTTLAQIQNLDPEVRDNLLVLHSILTGKSGLDRKQRIRTISEIYFIVFFKFDRIWSKANFLLLYRLFNYVGFSPFNHRTVWARWEYGFTAFDFLYEKKELNNPKDQDYDEHMTVIMDAIAEADKDEIYDTHHPCEYDLVLGNQNSASFDFANPLSPGVPESPINFNDQ